MAAILTHRLRQGLLNALVAGKSYSLPVMQRTDRVYEWMNTRARQSGKYTLWDHCFELPTKASAHTLMPDVTLRIQDGVTPRAEIYDFPGEYAQRFDGISKGGANRSPLPRHRGPVLYVGRKDRGVCIHGRPASSHLGCIVVTRGWTDLFRMLGAERQLSFVLEI